MAEASSPFALLCQLEQRYLAMAAPLPSPQKVVQHWSGIGFRLGQRLHTAPMSEVTEILYQPPCTSLPGVKSWVKGVANLRGRLLPILDLCSFFGWPSASQRKQHRVLVVEHGQTFVGLLVDEVFGMQHFPLDSFDGQSAELHQLEASISPFVHGVFQREQPWFVFSPHDLLADTQFLQVAA